MKLQTTLLLNNDFYIDYSSKIVSLGSCFSENIGELLQYHKFDICINPFGILFHPIAIKNIIKRIVLKEHFTEKDILLNRHLWCCLEVHSTLSNPSQQELLEKLNILLEESYQKLQNATHLFITLGTSWVYTHQATNTMVANCHKIPQKEFEKRILSTDEISIALKEIITLVNKLNPDITPVFTVSPVRHLKDGFIENQRSKAHLLTALHEVIDVEKAHYIPSYEIVMDELRDYRFYTEDLLHPNKIAIQYIWEKFINTYMDSTTQALVKKVNTVQKALTHKPLFPDSTEFKKFKKATDLKIAELQKSGISF